MSQSAMVAIAIVSADPILRRGLTQLLHGEPTVTIVTVADDVADVPLIDEKQLDAILADAPSRKKLADCRGKVALIVLLDVADDAETSLDALDAGARAILPRSAGREE